MATNKTIQPTNVTVQIPAMADKPNQDVNSNCIDKTIDGVNALNSNKANKAVYTTTNSFSSADVGTYVNNVLETIRTEISTYSNGIYDVSSGTGPRFGVILNKYNNSYWSALLITYSINTGALYYAKYQNGDCMVIILG